MDKKFIFYLFMILRSLRYLPRKFKRFVPQKIIAFVLFGLILWAIVSAIMAYWPTNWSFQATPQESGVVHLYSNESNPILKQTYLDAIYNAKSSILIVAFSLSDYAIINALNKQAQRGIKVTLVTDASTSENDKNPFNSAIKFLPIKGKGLMHLKLVVVDNAQVLVGSANITGASLKYHGNLAMELDSEVIAKAIQQEADYLANVSQQPPTSVIVQLPKQKVELWFMPTAGNAAFHRIMNLLYQARTSIRIAMFAWTHRRLADAVIDAHERGVKVEVVLDREQVERDNASVYQILVTAGVPVSLSNTSGLLHYKMAWIDDNILVNGSANWTLSAFNKNDDCFMVIDPLTVDQQRFMSELWQKISSAVVKEQVKAA